MIRILLNIYFKSPFYLFLLLKQEKNVKQASLFQCILQLFCRYTYCVKFDTSACQIVLTGKRVFFRVVPHANCPFRAADRRGYRIASDSAIRISIYVTLVRERRKNFACALEISHLFDLQGVNFLLFFSVFFLHGQCDT